MVLMVLPRSRNFSGIEAPLRPKDQTSVSTARPVGTALSMDALLWTAGIVLILLGAWLVMAPRFVPLGFLLFVAVVSIVPVWVGLFYWPPRGYGPARGGTPSAHGMPPYRRARASL